MNNRFLKLSPGYFALWVILCLVITSKVYLIRETTAGDFLEIGIFGIAMLVISYLGAWGIWTYSKKDQRTGELSYLVIMAVIFLVRTVALYSEAMAEM